MQEEWVICRILHKAGDLYSKLMMVKNPYYLPMAMEPSSFCFQQEPTAHPLTNPSGGCTIPLGLPFHHGHPGMQPPSPSNHGNKQVVFAGAAGCCMQQEPPNGSNSAVLPMPPFPPFTPIVAGKPAAPAPPPQVGVNAGPQEPPPPTWLEAYLQHSDGILYEMGPAAAPRGA